MTQQDRRHLALALLPLTDHFQTLQSQRQRDDITRSMETVARLHELAPDVRVGFLTRDCDEGIMAGARAAGAWRIGVRADQLTPEMAASIRRAGLGVGAWGVSDDSLLEQVVALGVDGFTTNWPDRGLRAVGGAS